MEFEDGRMPIEGYRKQEIVKLEAEVAELESMFLYGRTDPELATELRIKKQKLAQLKLDQGDSVAE